MASEIQAERLIALVDHVLGLSTETDWFERKLNNIDPDKMVRIACGLSNAARLIDQPFGYILWGVRDDNGQIAGTDFDPNAHKAHGQPLALWLAKALKPDLNFEFHVVSHPKGRLVLMQVPAAASVPTKCENLAYIRIGEATVKLERDGFRSGHSLS